MSRNPWTLVALVLTAAGAIAAAAPVSSSQTDSVGTESRPITARNVCEDRQVGETFGGDPKGCREYLDACLRELTSRQQADWARSVDECLADPETPFFRCYAQVPWC